ncbi:MAG TPA: cupredoxin domain-containing protein [Nitrososphaeraceae archaeon]
MRTRTTLLAIFIIVTAIALVTAGSITASTLAVKKKSTTAGAKKSTGSKKTTKSPKTSTGGSATTTAAGKGSSTLRGTSTTGGGTDQFSKFVICMRLFSGPLTRAEIDQCYNIVYGTSGSSIGSSTHTAPATHTAAALGTTTTRTNGAATIQLSAKEITSGVYRWTNSTTGMFNPSMKVFANANNIIKIQNPSDTKHELIIDTGADVLPSSGDVAPHGSGQLSFTPTSTGTFTYHCAYHPSTMNGIVKVVAKP